MYYEVYLDNLFLINFIMNLLGLTLVNLVLLHPASRRRLLLGAFLGASTYVATFLLPGPVWWKVFSGFAGSGVGMLLGAFPIRTPKTFLKTAGLLLSFSFLLGGGILWAAYRLPALFVLTGYSQGLLCVAALLTLILTLLLSPQKKKPPLCTVTLKDNGHTVSVQALIDTGNSLQEPISGKPVCVLETEVFAQLKGKDADFSPSENEWAAIRGFRAIPYSSVGNKHGILPGFPVPEMQVEQDGILRSFSNVYVGLASDKISENGSCQMILNPSLFRK